MILTYSQLALLDKRLDAEQRETIATCERAAQRMRGLIESLLRLARLDAGEDLLPRGTVDLVAVACEAAELLRPAAALRNVTVTTILEPAMTYGDASGLVQVVTNLVDNAIYYGRENGSVRVTVGTVKDDSLWAQIEVADDGPGIPEEHAAHIFDRFYRVDEARTGTHGRTGLGLAISKAIVVAHGGTILVESRAGQGTIFTIRMPAAATTFRT